MRFEIEFTPEALEDVVFFKKHERRRIIEGIESQLERQPAVETRNRKRLRPNQLAEWELRIDKFRVFYDVDTREGHVRVVSVGCKRGNRLVIREEEYWL